MDADEFEAAQRAGERFHALTVPAGMWTILRVDGRAFSRFTRDRFEKPFDQRFSGHMITTAIALLTERLPGDGRRNRRRPPGSKSARSGRADERIARLAYPRRDTSKSTLSA